MRRAWRLLRWLVVTEIRMYVGALRFLTRRADVPADAIPVRYVGAVSLALWTFTIVSAVELVALHLILPWPTVRLVADILGIWGVVWCLGLTGCHYVYPHLVTDTALRVRNAARPDVLTLDWARIASVRMRERGVDSGRALQIDAESPDTLIVCVGSRTNVEVSLTDPVEVVVRGLPHLVREVRLYVDEPRGAVAAIRSCLAGGASARS